MRRLKLLAIGLAWVVIAGITGLIVLVFGREKKRPKTELETYDDCIRRVMQTGKVTVFRRRDPGAGYEVVEEKDP